MFCLFICFTCFYYLRAHILILATFFAKPNSTGILLKSTDLLYLVVRCSSI